MAGRTYSLYKMECSCGDDGCLTGDLLVLKVQTVSTPSPSSLVAADQRMVRHADVGLPRLYCKLAIKS